MERLDPPWVARINDFRKTLYQRNATTHLKDLRERKQSIQGNLSLLALLQASCRAIIITQRKRAVALSTTLTDLIGVMPSEGGLLTVVGGDLLLEDGIGGEYSEVFPATESFWFGVANTLDNYPQWVTESPLNPTAPGTISFQVPAWSIGYLALGSPAATIAIPEPSTATLVNLALAGLMAGRRRRRLD